MSLINSLRSEVLKTKRGATLYFTLVAAAIVPLIFLLDVSFDGVSPENRVDSFNAFFREGFAVISLIIFPMFIVIVCTLLPQIEYRNNAWKQVFASPQTMADIFVAKFIHVQVLILLFLLSFNAFMFLISVATHFIDPSLDLLHQPLSWKAIGTFNANAYLAIAAISAIQFWVGLRFKNFLVPIAIGFALWLSGNMLLLEFNNSHANLFPYAYPAFSIFPKYKSQLAGIQLSSILYAAVFLVIGYVDFRRRRIKG